ncbi:hypothetical protein D5018_18830 [Parashewanella curva]|uniref:Uncharacterized protein n=1 Tax=Parashewanella curva TaxID=2338552 RepID=A0A3L8PVR9_9GAMM|nr:hypothetical protein [Parashewanella curva]RLV58152.1 hypothetical protein D5018_18830 [Parashewanella curva]
MEKTTLSLKILSFMYCLVAIIGVWRIFDAGVIELFTFGVLPILYGVFTHKSWTLILLKIYLAIQLIGICGFSIVGFIAYQINPDDVVITFKGINIPLIPLSISVVILLVFQFWVAFSKENRRYFSRFTATD